MESLVFLLIAAAIVVLGTAFLVLRSREPKGDDHAIVEFQREMKALSAEQRKHTTDAAGVRIVRPDDED
jgi:hypothetical protein